MRISTIWLRRPRQAASTAIRRSALHNNINHGTTRLFCYEKDETDLSQSSESRLYTFSQESKDHLRKFRLGTSRANDPQAVICMFVSLPLLPQLNFSFLIDLQT